MACGVLATFTVWRIVLSFFALTAASLPYARNQAYTRLPENVRAAYTILQSPALEVFTLFDGIHYLQIAAEGYHTNTRFFPLFPVVLRAGVLFTTSHVPPIFHPVWIITGVVITHACLFVAILFWIQIVRRVERGEWSNTESNAQGASRWKWAVLALLIFPTSFFLGQLYSESLFLLLTLSSALLIEQRRWGWATLCVALLSLTRLVGVLYVPLLWWCMVLVGKSGQLRWKWQQSARAAWVVVAPVLVLMAFAVLCWYVTGDPLSFVHGHGELANGRSVGGVVLPLQTVWRYIRLLSAVPLGVTWWVALFEVASFVGGCLLMVVGTWRIWQLQKMQGVGLPWHLLVFSWICFLVPMSSGTFSGLPRYLLPCWPMYIALTYLPRGVRGIVFGGCFVLQVIVFVAFSRGYFVG